MTTVNIRDINPLEHITSDLSKAQFNYQSILNGLVAWNVSDNQVVTVRLATDSGFVDYTFPTRHASSSNTAMLASGSTANDGCFDVDNRLQLTVAGTDDPMNSDSVTLRLTVSDNLGYRWQVFEDIDIHDTNSGIPGSYYIDNNRVYIVKAGGVSQEQVQDWQAAEPYAVGTVALFNGRVFILLGANSTSNPIESTAWTEIGTYLNDIAEGMPIEHGKVYMYKNWDDSRNLYIYRGNTVVKTSSGPEPTASSNDEFTDNPWYGPVAIMPVAKIEKSTVLHHTPTTDLRGFIVKCLDSGMGVGMISGMANVAIKANPTEPHKGLKIFDTANFALWPNTNSPVWQDGHTYSYNDDNHTAKMVFHHADPDTKVTNIVNYDGPDLDRGLCIYLPVTDKVSDNGGNPVEVKPKDGAIIEFMFRIWPRTELNGRETADLIVNKAQIYVYTVGSSDNLDEGKIIAKFSMARVTNFYIWAENVAIPNRPVFYKAKFIYSETYREWKTYDYYQIPDHVFLAPKGFVDPSLRLYADDGFYPGLETAGFPLMQDPFGGLDLTRIRLNRIEEDAPAHTAEVTEEPPGE